MDKNNASKTIWPKGLQLPNGNSLKGSKNNASVYARPNGLQLPKGSITKGSTNSILTKEQIVNLKKSKISQQQKESFLSVF